MDYDNICKAKTSSQKKEDARKNTVTTDIEKINTALENNSYELLLTTHQYIDGKYQVCVAGWNQSVFGFIPGCGFNYEVLDHESLIHNLQMMQAKLDGFLEGWNIVGNESGNVQVIPDINVNTTTNFNITITFEQVRKEIEEMGTLNQKETDEAIEKVNELEAISKENISRKAKWEKVKPIIKFAMEKGADLGIAMLTLVVQMKLNT